MNLHYQFWVDYYKELESSSELSKEKIEKKNSALIHSQWEDSGEKIPSFGKMQLLTYKVLYPGLLMGLGYDHSAEQAKDAPKIALGMSLDYTTGLPYIPGSEVKGMLRSAFIGSKDLINLYLGKDWSDEKIHALEVDIFGHTHNYDPDYKPSKEAEEGQGKDVFFDAFPIKPDSNGHLIELENITSHISYDSNLEENPRKYQGLTDVNPITLLKVMPGVVFLFRFKLCDSVIKTKEEEIIVTVDEKLRLFENIIANFGMGAKTYVGFGLMEKVPDHQSVALKRHYLFSAGSAINLPSGQNETPTVNTPTVQQTERPRVQAAFVVGQEYTATIKEAKKNNLKLTVKDADGNAAYPAYKRDDIPEPVRRGEKDLTKVFAIGETWRVRCDGTESTENGTLKHKFTLIGKQENNT